MYKIMDNICLIGSSHIAKQSIKEIEKQYLEFKPTIIGVELDKARLTSIFSKKKGKFSFYSVKSVGVGGFLFAIIAGWVSEKLGKAVGVIPGIDMKTAVIMARHNKAKVLLMDQNINHTLRRFSQEVKFKEKMRIVGDIFKGIFKRKKMINELGIGNLDLTKVPAEDTVIKLIGYIKKRYPGIYKVLIDERNLFMANRIILARKQFPDEKIMAVVGAGHMDGIIRLLRSFINNKKLGVNYEIQSD